MGAMTRNVHEGRREGLRRFCISGELQVELGLMCTEEDEELRAMCRPQCWHGIDADPGGLKKTMWFEVLKEFKLHGCSTELTAFLWSLQ